MAFDIQHQKGNGFGMAKYKKLAPRDESQDYQNTIKTKLSYTNRPLGEQKVPAPLYCPSIKTLLHAQHHVGVRQIASFLKKARLCEKPFDYAQDRLRDEAISL